MAFGIKRLPVTDLQVSGGASLVGITEPYDLLTSSTGTVVHDFSTNSVFMHSSISANFTANFTNVPATGDIAIGVALILEQGGTAYLPIAVQINGSAQTINWVDGSEPTGTAGQYDIVSFTFIYSDGSWIVLGALTTFATV